MKRRSSNISASFATLILSACSSFQGGDWSQIWQIASTSWSSDNVVTREQAAAIPFASMGVSIDESDEFILVLVQSGPGSLLWTSASRIVLVTENGRIVRTVGLENDLIWSAFSSEDWLSQGERIGLANLDARRTIDLASIDVYSARVECVVTELGNENISILGTDIPTRHMEETCHAPDLNWSFVNQFWLGQTSGFVWQSVQHVHPQLGPIQTRIFRPPA